MDTFVDLLDRHARERGQQRYCTFLRDGDRDEEVLTYRQLRDEARQIARLLADFAAKGSRVILLYPNGNDFIKAFFGVLEAGAIAVPVHPCNPARPGAAIEHLERIAADCRAEVVLTTSVLLDALQDTIAISPVLSEMRWLASEHFDLRDASDWRGPRLEGGNLAVLQYTSGSTSHPKGVMITHGNLLANAAMMAEAFLPDRTDFVWVSWLPHYHDMGLIGGILTPMGKGAQLVLMTPAHFTQVPGRWLRAIERYQAVITCAPNFAYELCARGISAANKAKLDLRCWQLALTGSEPVRADTIRRFESEFASCGFAPTVFNPCYGLAENTLVVSGSKPCTGASMRDIQELPHDGEAGEASSESTLRVSCGNPPSTVRVRIVDPATRQPVASELHEGEIWVQGPSVAKGYWRNPEATEAAFNGRIVGAEDSGAWLRTGDLGRLIDGHLYVTGRIKDTVIIDGRKIYPVDVEQFVQGLDRRLKFGKGIVFGIQTDAGEGLVLAQEANLLVEQDQQDLVRQIRAQVYEYFRVPLHTVLLVKSGGVPRTFNGKLQRQAGRHTLELGGFPILFRSSIDQAQVNGP